MSSEKVQQNGKIRYVEPNDFLEDREYNGQGVGSFNITHPYEDYSISVDLIVTVPDRNGSVSSNKEFTIELGNSDGKTVSFFNGEDGYLNCTPGSQTFIDIMNGDTAGHHENLGITNIQVTYNSYFYPEVTMNLVDIRGLSLMSPHEENYRRAQWNELEKQKEKEAKEKGLTYKPQLYDKKIANFFSALFTFPYPEFKLRIKGFYGKKVEFSLLVNDFKSAFNSQTGNFEATVKFIGKMYGVYSDIPMSYLMIAPYCKYGNENNKTIWETKNFEVDGVPMPTFLELKDAIANVSKELPSTMGYETVNKLNNVKNKLVLLLNVQDTYEVLKKRVELRQKDYSNHVIYKYDSDIFIFFPTNDNNDYDYLFNKSGIDLSVRLKALYDSIDKYNNDIDNNKLPLLEPTINNVNVLNLTTCEFNDNSHNAILKYENENYNIYFTENFKISDTIYNKNVKYDITKIKNFNNIQHQVKTKIGNNSGKDYKCKIISGEQLNKDIQELIKVTNEEIKEITKLAKDEYTKGIEELFGFKPTLKNIVKITMAHLDVFLNIYMKFIENVRERTINDTGLNNDYFDIPNHKINSLLPPFPGIKDNETNEFCYPTDVIHNYIMEETNLIDSFFHSFSDFSNLLNQIDYNVDKNNTSNFDFIPTLYTDLLNPNNPYENTLKDTQSNLDVDKIMTFLGIRSISYLIFERQNNESDFGKLEAYNFWVKNKEISIELKEKIKNDKFNKDEFFKFLTGDSECEYIKNTSTKKPYYYKNDKTSYLITNDGYNQANTSNKYYGINNNFNFPATINNINEFWNHMNDNNCKYSWTTNENLHTRFDVFIPYTYYNFIDKNNISTWENYLNTINIGNIKNETITNIISKCKISENCFMENYSYSIRYGDDYNKDEFYVELNSDTFKSKTKKITDYYNDNLDKSYKLLSFNSYNGYPLFFEENITPELFLCSIPYNMNILYEKVNNSRKYDSNGYKIDAYFSELSSTPINLVSSIITIPYAMKLFMGMIISKIMKSTKENNEIYVEYNEKKIKLNEYLNELDKMISSISGRKYLISSILDAISFFVRMKDGSINYGSSYITDFVDKLKKNEIEYNNDFLQLSNEYEQWVNNETKGGFKYFIKEYSLKNTNENQNTTKFETFVKYLEINKENKEGNNIKDYLNKLYKNEETEFKSGQAFSDRYSQIVYIDEDEIVLIFNENFKPYQELCELFNKNSFLLFPFPTTTKENDMSVHKTQFLVEKESFLKIFENFKHTLKELYNLNKNENEDIVNKDIEEYKIHRESKLSMYMTLKNLYDKHLTTLSSDINNKYNLYHENSEFNRFHFLDTFYNDLGDEFYVNLNQLLTTINDITNPYKSETDKGLVESNLSVYSFLSLLCERHNMMLLAMPIFNGLFTKSDNINSTSIEDMFKPFTYLDTINDNSLIGPSYVCFYPHQPSQFLDIPESQYKNDGFTIIKDINNTATFEGASTISDLLNDEGKYIVPSFGVEYGTQKQSIFKSINVNMDNPQTTEAAVANQFAIAQGRNVQIKNPGFEGQDLYKIYSNYSFTCQVEMMGCAQIMPLMYFQLNNIPMFRGAYQIIQVYHNITPGNMTTTFKGVRIANRKIPIVKNLINISTINEIMNSDNSTMNSKSTPFNGDLFGKVENNHQSEIDDLKDNEVTYQKLKSEIIFDPIKTYTNNNVEEAFNKVNTKLRKLLKIINDNFTKYEKENNNETVSRNFKIVVTSSTRNSSDNTVKSSSDHFIPNYDKNKRSKLFENRDGEEISYSNLGCALDLCGAHSNGSKDAVNVSLPLFHFITTEFTDNIRQLIWEHKTGISSQQDSISNTIHLASYGSGDDNDKCEIFVAQKRGENFPPVIANNKSDTNKTPTNLPPTFIKTLYDLSQNDAKYINNTKLSLPNFKDVKGNIYKPTKENLKKWCEELFV